MDISSLHYDFKIKMDRVDTLSNQDFNAAEIDWLLNEAQLLFIKQRFTASPNSKFKGFEADAKRLNDLSTLVIKFPLQPGITPTLDSGVYEVSLSSLLYPYLFLVSAHCSIQYDDNCIVENVPLKFFQHNNYLTALRDPFNEPSTEFIPYNLGRSSSNPNVTSLYAYPNDLDILEIFLEYIKYPSKVSLGNYTYIDGITYPPTSLELPEHTHSEVVDLAVQLASISIENPELIQLKNAKILINE